MLSESSECKAEKRGLPRRISLFRKDISGISADGIFLKKGDTFVSASAPLLSIAPSGEAAAVSENGTSHLFPFPFTPHR